MTETSLVQFHDGKIVNSSSRDGFNYMLLTRSTIYVLGDITYSKELPTYTRLECIQAGVTGDSDPTFVSTVGSYITDGTVIWAVDDVRDSVSTGDIVYRPFLKAGYIKANGAIINREDYPRLVAYATDNNLWGTDVYQFGEGDGSTTMVLPDYQDSSIEGGSSVSVVTTKTSVTEVSASITTTIKLIPQIKY